MKTGNKEALLLLANIYMQHGKRDKARLLLEALQEVAADDPYVSRALAWISVTDKRHADALEHIRAWERMEQHPSPEHRHIMLLIKASALSGVGREAEARVLLDDFLARNTGDISPAQASRHEI